MGFIGKFAAFFTERYIKALSAFIGAAIGAVVGQIFAYVVEQGFGTCAVVASESICTISIGPYNWSSAEVSLWLTGIAMAWLSTHAVKSSPANK